MESFTTHNPSVCLQPDDYEALITMYPVCYHLPPHPRCEKPARNIGVLKCAIFVAGPFILAMLISVTVHWSVDRTSAAQTARAATPPRTRARASTPLSF